MTDKAWPYPLWIAHRGAGKLAPENTLAAFKLGADHGYRAFECDVKLSSDEQPFLMHDVELDRTTPDQGRAGERSWQELSQLDAGHWHSSEFVGEPIPSLEDVARYVQGHDFTLNIEIKPTPGMELRTGQVVGKHVRHLWRDPAQTLPLCSSFSPQALEGARETAPEVPRALLLDQLWVGCAEMALSLQCVALVVEHKLVDAAFVTRTHAAGLRLLCYTVNESDEVNRLLRLHVDGIITDAVDRFSPDANEFQITRPSALN